MFFSGGSPKSVLLWPTAKEHIHMQGALGNHHRDHGESGVRIREYISDNGEFHNGTSP